MLLLRGRYVATNPNVTSDGIALMHGLFPGLKLTTSTQLPADLTAELRSELERLRVPRPLFGDVLGIVEQVVCAAAFDFVGTYWSTFSEYIDKMRATERREFLLPQLTEAWPTAESSWPHNYPQSDLYC